MPPTTPLPIPLPSPESRPTQTLLLDSTISSDGLSLLHHVTRSLPAKSARPIFLATRTHTPTSAPSSRGSVVPRNAHLLDAYDITDSRGVSAGATLLRAVGEVVDSRGIVVVECLHALKFVFGVNPAAFVRSLSALRGGVSVVACAAKGCGLDDEITSLVNVADVIVELTDLQTGYAEDIDGMIRVAREGGRWIDRRARRYKVTASGFTLYT